MLPSSGAGGRTPAPTKLRPAVSRMAKPTVTDTCTITGWMALGRTWRKPTRASELPTARAASANGRWISDSTSARTRRTKTGVFTKATAAMMLIVLPPNTATSTMAKTKTGKAWITSRKRITASAPARPPRPRRLSNSATTTPIGAPTSTEIAVATSAISTSMRGAASRRDRISMPLSSVPSQCAALGGSRRSLGEAPVAE